MKENTTPELGNPLLFIIGLITAFIGFGSLHTFREMRNIEVNGQLAAMHTDSVIGSRKKETPKLYLSYKGKTYVRDVGEMEKFLYTKGNKVKVKFIPGDSYVILPSDRPRRGVMISGFFAGVGSLFVLLNLRAFVRRLRQIMREPSNTDHTLWK